MPSLLQDRASRCFHVRFRYAGQSYKRSLKTRDKREAKTVLSRVDETIRLLERGRLEMPPDADPGVFILSDGTRNGKPKPVTIRTLADLFKT